MTPPRLPVPATAPGFVVLDLDLSDREPLAEAAEYEVGLLMLAVQEQFYDQLDANGEGGTRTGTGTPPRARPGP